VLGDDAPEQLASSQEYLETKSRRSVATNKMEGQEIAAIMAVEP
jgi:hypothetical protein